METYRIINASNAIPPGRITCVSLNPMQRYVVVPCTQGEKALCARAGSLKLRMVNEIMNAYRDAMAAGMTLDVAEEKMMEFLTPLNAIADAQAIVDMQYAHGEALIRAVQAAAQNA